MKRIAEAKLSHVLAGTLPIRLHLRNDLHLVRKTWHLVMGSIIALAYLAGVDTSTAVITLSCFLGLDLLIETARLRAPSLNEKVMRYAGPFMRSCEVDRMSGIPYYLLSTIIAIGIFPKPVAVLSILYLSCGDPIASLFGILYGHKSVRLANGKSLIGTAAGVLACTLVSFFFLRSIGIDDQTTLAVALVGGLAGGTVELLPLDLDDNFTIPVVSGFVLWLAFIAAGI
jgi:diacylglycerol kinase (CTP)